MTSVLGHKKYFVSCMAWIESVTRWTENSSTKPQFHVYIDISTTRGHADNNAHRPTSFVVNRVFWDPLNNARMWPFHAVVNLQHCCLTLLDVQYLLWQRKPNTNWTIYHVQLQRNTTWQKMLYTRWFEYDQDDLCVNKSQFVPVIFEPRCIYIYFFFFFCRTLNLSAHRVSDNTRIIKNDMDGFSHVLLSVKS
jgi:hypothetical protein